MESIEKAQKKRRAIKWAIGACLIPFIVATYQVYLTLFVNQGSTPPAGTNSPASSETSPITVTPSPTSTNLTPSQSSNNSPETNAEKSRSNSPDSQPKDPSTSAHSPENTRGFTPKEMDLKDAVSEEWCRWPGNTGYDWKSLRRLSQDHPVIVAGTTQSRGVACNMRRNEASGYIDFTVPQGASFLDVTAGQMDNSELTSGTVTFEVIDTVSNEVLESTTLPFGKSESFKIPVNDLIRIRLKVTAHSTDGEVDLWAAWANPIFS